MPQKNTDIFIYMIFVLEYIIRFIASKEKKKFLRSNILDLIAILPISSAMRIFRLGKLTRLAKISKLFRLTAVSGRALHKTRSFLDTNGFKYMLLISGFVILISAIAIGHFENMSIKDSLWWSFVTATTVGYGDLSPSTDAGRIIACILMICGIGLIGSLTSTITSFFMRANPKNTSANSEKIKMVLVLYNELTADEKDEFKKIL